MHMYSCIHMHENVLTSPVVSLYSKLASGSHHFIVGFKTIQNHAHGANRTIGLTVTLGSSAVKSFCTLHMHTLILTLVVLASSILL